MAWLVRAEGIAMSLNRTGERTWLDERADRFESDWKQAGQRPRIEDHLAGESGPRRSGLLRELLRVECELRTAVGETPVREEYLERFPEDGAAVRGAFGSDDHPRTTAGIQQSSAAQSLLFGLLALQNDFVDRETLLAAFNVWVADKSKSLGQILLDRGALSLARHAVLEELVREHMDKHGQDSERSLAVLAIDAATRVKFEEVHDLDLHASLLMVRLAGTDDVLWKASRPQRGTRRASSLIREVAFGLFVYTIVALGEVYVARDQQLHRIVALKRIKLDQAADREQKARFVVEAEITGRLEHPGIVPVYGLGTFEDGRPFYAMRFIRGDNLKSAIEQFHRDDQNGVPVGKRKPGAPEFAGSVPRRLQRDRLCAQPRRAASRSEAGQHHARQVRRDAGRRLGTRQGRQSTRERCRYSDSRRPYDRPPVGHRPPRHRDGGAMGTPAYMSPEQAAGRIDRLGPASDVYSLGATLYCLLTGRAPFADQDLGRCSGKLKKESSCRRASSNPRSTRPWRRSA